LFAGNPGANQCTACDGNANHVLDGNAPAACVLCTGACLGGECGILRSMLLLAPD
jgi:hypothetical protein